MRLWISAMLLASTTATAAPALAQDGPPPGARQDEHRGDARPDHERPAPQGDNRGGGQQGRQPDAQRGEGRGPGGGDPRAQQGRTGGDPAARPGWSNQQGGGDRGQQRRPDGEPGRPGGYQDHGGYQGRGDRPDGPGGFRGPNGGQLPGGQGGYRAPVAGGYAGDGRGWTGQRDDRRGPDGHGPDGRGRGDGPGDGGRGWDRGHQGGDWNRGWREDRRYDWQGWRAGHRDLYRGGGYRAPQGYGYGYRRFAIGGALPSIFFAQRYWIGNPGYYRLPPAYGAYRWVRYYNDALLIDTYSGVVVDAIPAFFY